MDDIFALITAVSGLSKDDLIDGALHPEKQPEAWLAARGKETQ